MATGFQWSNLFASAAFFGDLGAQAIAALPLSNLLDPQPRIRTRYTTTTGIQIWCDFGSVQSVSCVALISTTLGAAGGSPTVRVQVGNDAGFASADWDTGAVDPATDDYAGGNVVFVHPTTASGRYLRIDVNDAAADVVDIGCITAGLLWRPSSSPAYGFEEGRLILDRRDRNGFTGAEFAVPAVVNPRTARFTLPYISRAQAIAEWRSILNQLGATGDVLWVPDDSLSLAELNQRSIWGGIVQPGEAATLQRASFVHHTRSFTLTERV